MGSGWRRPGPAEGGRRQSPVLGVEVGVGTQIDGRVVAKDVGGDGRVDALSGQQRGTGVAQRVGRNPRGQAGTVDDLAQQPPEVPEANRLPVLCREDQGVVFGTDGAGQMAVEVRGDRRRKRDRPAPMRLAIRPDEMATDLVQSLDDQHAAVIAKVAPSHGERGRSPP